jgi:DNA modification methylase
MKPACLPLARAKMLRPPAQAESNVILAADKPIHAWYRFVLSFPPHLVRRYLASFNVKAKDLVFDPFCGTGTTLVEAKKAGIQTFGTDAHPFAAMVSRVKTKWDVDTANLRRVAARIIDESEAAMLDCGLEPLSLSSRLRESPVSTAPPNLSEEQMKLIPTGFVSDRPLHRILILIQAIDRIAARRSSEFRELFLLAVANVIANGAENFAFGPEIYRTKPKDDYDVLGHFTQTAFTMAGELDAVQKLGLDRVSSTVARDDARTLEHAPDGIDTVITSPPYPNEKDYTRTTRVESILLGLLSTKGELREVKELLLRSNTRNVFVNDSDGAEVEEFSSIRNICGEIERSRKELNKTSGFEKLYHKVVAHYFGGMRRHFRALRPKLKKGANLAYVVGDQLSFLMVPVPTGEILGEIAHAEGYKVLRCDLWRERIGTKIRNDLENRKTVRVKEEVLILKA